jgi:hypothetical protein
MDASKNRIVRQPHPFCVVFDGDEAVEIGALHARTTNKFLLTLNEIDGRVTIVAQISARSITFVASPAVCRVKGWDFFSRLARDLTGLPDMQFAWGLVTGSSLAEMELFVRRLAESSPTRCSGGDLEASVAYLHGHGRSYCGNAGSLCSKDAEDSSRGCSEDYACVFGPEPPIALAFPSAPIAVFNNCCASSLLQRGPGRDGLRNIALQQLKRSASAVIAPHGTQVVDGNTGLVAQCLGELGYTAGEIMLALNNFIRTRAGVPGDLVLLGDPEATCSGHREPVSVAPVRLSQTDWHVILPTNSQRIAVFSCYDEDLRSAACGALHVRSGTLTVVLVREENRLLIIVPSSIDATASVILTRVAPLSLAHLSAASQLAGLFAPERHSALERLLHQAELGLSGVVGRDTQTAVLHQYLLSFALELSEVVRQATYAVIEALAVRRDQGFWLFRHLSEFRGIRFIAHENGPARRCPHCELPLRERLYSVGLHQSEKRLLLECERCMLVADYPSITEPMYLDAPDTVRCGETFSIKLCGKELNTQIFGCAAICIDLLDQPAATFSARTVLGEASAGPRPAVYQFEATFGPDVLPHLYNIHAIAVHDGHLFWAQGRILVIQ